MQLYRYFVSQSGEFCRHNPLCCFSTCVCCCCLFLYDSVRKLLVTAMYYKYLLGVVAVKKSAHCLEKNRGEVESLQKCDEFISSLKHIDRTYFNFRKSATLGARITHVCSIPLHTVGSKNICPYFRNSLLGFKNEFCRRP
jgi:hypothetical protein